MKRDKKGLVGELFSKFKELGSITEAAKAVGIPRKTASDWIHAAGLKGQKPLPAPSESDPAKDMTKIGLKICYIPDTQVKPGQDFDFLRCIGEYICEKRPDVIIHAGDFSDMASLSSYDKGKKAAEGKRIQADIDATHEAMDTLLEPIHELNRALRKKGAKTYRPRMCITVGNHEDRINRFANDNPEVDGFLSVRSLGYEVRGWEVIPFKEILSINGVNFCHYFYNPNSGKPYGGTAMTKLKNIGLSFVMGHQQGFDFANRELPNGKRQCALVAGSCYDHDEDYRGPQANGHWHGICMLHEVKDGAFDLCQVSLEYLKEKYKRR